MAEKLLILGMGEHGRVCKEIAESMGRFSDILFLDDLSAEAAGRLDQFERFKDSFGYAYPAFGNNLFRLQWMDKLEKAGFQLPILTHASCYVSPSASVGTGTVIEPHAIVNANCKIGRGCILSIGTIMDHDCVVEDGCHIDCGTVLPPRSQVAYCKKVTCFERLENWK